MQKYYVLSGALDVAFLVMAFGQGTDVRDNCLTHEILHHSSLSTEYYLRAVVLVIQIGTHYGGQGGSHKHLNRQ